MATLFTLPNQVRIGASGAPYAGATASFYSQGTLTLQSVYQDNACTTVHSDPVTADAAGQFPKVFLNPNATADYRIIIKSSSGVTLDDEDDIPRSPLTQDQIGQILYPRTQPERDALATPVNSTYPEGYVDRYATNTSPGATDMGAAILAAINVAHAHGDGGVVVFLPGVRYRTTAAIDFPTTSVRIHVYGNGAYLKADHTGNGVNWLATNENYSGHSISDLTITGPNPLSFGASNTSTGAGINMNRNTTTNAVTAYNNRLRNVVVQGFKYGLDLQSAIALGATDCYILYNEYGVQFDGGQSNANSFVNCHIRYNRNRAISSTGRTGGSLTNATNNKFTNCLIESNVPDTGISGGTPPTDSTAIYLNNSYDFVFRDCYSENHAASIYLTGSSKGNKFLNHRLSPGTGRLDQVVLDGAGIYNNKFELKASSASLTEISVVSNDADQLFNDFSGEGINFIAANVLAPLYFSDIKPSLAFANTKGYGLLRMPSQGYASNVGEGTTPGLINGIGTGGAALNARGLGEIAIGNGITGATTITSVTGLAPNSMLVLRSTQASFNVTLSGSAFGLAGGYNAILSTSGQEVVLWVGGDGNPREVGRNFIISAGVYTVTNPSTDRALNVSADTVAQVAAVVGTLVADLQARGYLS